MLDVQSVKPIDTSPQGGVVAAVRALAARELPPLVNTIDVDGHYPEAQMRAFGRLGAYAHHLPGMSPNVDLMTAMAAKGEGDAFALTHDSLAGLMPKLPGVFAGGDLADPADGLAGARRHRPRSSAQSAGRRGRGRPFGDRPSRTRCARAARCGAPSPRCRRSARRGRRPRASRRPRRRPARRCRDRTRWWRWRSATTASRAAAAVRPDTRSGRKSRAPSRRSRPGSKPRRCASLDSGTTSRRGGAPSAWRCIEPVGARRHGVSPRCPT